ncbi:MAG: hypothetical protein IH838_02285 [Proteobacteria bacterium]|nr:hypothetical protein [Pseudomonadota bacterium]
MPELNVIHIAIIAAMTVVGAIVGWLLRGSRAEEEKAAVSAGWQEQIKAQRTEHDRLTGQNKGLMEQISQYQASNTDAKNRAQELSEAVQEAYSRRDQLQREIKDIRADLGVSVSERDQLRSDMSAQDRDSMGAVEKDSRIAKLQVELENWQNRLPPLIEKYRQRNEDAEQLEVDLRAAQERIAELEADDESSQTRIEPVTDPDSLTDGRDASNDPIDEDEDEIEAESNDEADVEAESNDEADVEADVEAESNDEADVEAESNDEADVEAESNDEADIEAESNDEADVEAESDDEAEADVEAEADDEAESDDEADSAWDDDAINGARDTLQDIKGIGPAIEKTLNEMGIFRFQQIAEMSEYEIDRVAKRLKGFRSRIYREDWIGQARELRDQEASG